MKKVLSILLSLILTATVFSAVPVSAAEADVTTKELCNEEECVKVVDGVIYEAIRDYSSTRAPRYSVTVKGFVDKTDTTYTIKEQITFESFNVTLPIEYVAYESQPNFSTYHGEEGEQLEKLVTANNVKELVFPDSIKTIRYLSELENLEKVYFGKNVESFDGSFTDCPKLKEFVIDEENRWFKFDGKRIMNGSTQWFEINPPTEYTVPKSVRDIRLAFNIPVKVVRVHHKMESITYSGGIIGLKQLRFSKNGGAENIELNGLPSLVVIKYGKVNTILNYSGCFRGSSITKVTIPSPIERIERDAFRYCDELKKVYIAGSVTAIANNAFASTDSLKRVEFKHKKTLPKITKTSFEDTPSGIKFVVQNKKLAKQLKKKLKGKGVENAKIYYRTSKGFKLAYKNVE